MGIVDTLAAGFSTVNRRLWLIAIPVLLDLLLWLGPQLSMAPLVEGAFAQFDRALTALNTELTQQGQPLSEDQLEQISAFQTELSTIGRELGDANVLEFIPSPFTHLLYPPLQRILASPLPLALVVAPLPSLLNAGGANLWASPFERPVGTVGSFAVLAPLWLLLVALGQLVASAYLSAIGGSIRVRQGRTKGFEGWARLVGVNWLRLLALLLLSGLFFWLVFLPLAFFGALVGVFSAPLGVLVLSLIPVVPLWTRIYFYFTDGAIFVNDKSPLRAIASSFQVVQRNFWPSLLLIALIHFVLIGLSLAWTPLLGHPVGVAAAILGNAYTATGLIAGAMIFYRDRALALERQRVVGLPTG